MTGRCNCGAVRFALHGEVQGVFVCHCSLCRRTAGSNGMAVVVVPNERFAWTAGEDQVRGWKMPDRDWEAWFCATCGSTLPGANDPERMFVPAGLLDDADHLRVTHHIFVDSRAPWDEIGGDAVQHPGGFGSTR